MAWNILYDLSSFLNPAFLQRFVFPFSEQPLTTALALARAVGCCAFGIGENQSEDKKIISVSRHAPVRHGLKPTHARWRLAHSLT